jgi:phosphoserine phosphatase RsbX
VAAPSLVDWGVAARTLAGEAESGDLHLVRPVATGVLVSVVDGLGHGVEAATAARVAVGVLDQHADGLLLPLLEQCHRALAGTRGVVMSLAFFDGAGSTLTWLGVGNVEGVLLSAHRPPGRPAHTSLVTRGGIVGSELPPLRAQLISIAPGDTLIFASDGIERGFVDSLPAHDGPQQLADQILTHYGTGADDALVLVARYLGAESAR